MSPEKLTKIPTRDYSIDGKCPPIYRMKVHPNFSPVDINIQFIIEEGWSHADRLRFHLETKIKVAKDHPLTTMLTNLKPHLLIRRYDREEDSFLTVFISQKGEIEILSNDCNFARRYLNGLFLECPPSFHSAEELEIIDEWVVDDQQICAMFLGLLHGALGWDPSQQIPPAIRTSFEEAEKALSIANYRSCVVMCRRTIEALLKFAFPRLLGSKAIDNKGKALTLNAMIGKFKNQKTSPIPTHLLHVLDSVRVIGNVPAAHAAEIEGYQFSKSDAEFALASVHYFVEQYFSKIDAEVLGYYTLTIDLN
ncbi:MAG: DUF4145 domain-containing protein [bacterium]|nr:DUF4145 domain-containing protein [bacterium]